jgi:hypothetical protein
MTEIEITPADVMKMAQVLSDLSTAFQGVGQTCGNIGTDVGNAANDASGAAAAIEKGASEVFSVLGKAFTLFDEICGKSGSILTDYVNNLTKLDNGIATTIGKIGQYTDEAGAAATKISSLLK